MTEESSTTLGLVSSRVEPRMGRISSASRCHKLPRTLEMDYTLTSKILGHGYAGAVVLATSKDRVGNEQRTVAVKTFMLKKLKDSQKLLLRNETEVFLCMDHPHVARLLDVYETEDKISLVMECVSGGELFDRVAKEKHFTEPQAAQAMRQMLLAVHYIHSHGIVHRDLKLENFLYDLKDSNHLKMIDFGFSKFFDRRQRMKTSCGTTAYVAPEVLEKNYTSQCDLWSMGVVCFTLLSGHMPFYGESVAQLKSIKEGNYKFKDYQWTHCSKGGKQFIQALLECNPEKRLTAKAALEHKWIKAHCGQLLKHKVDASVLDSIASWTFAPKLNRACLSMVSWSLTNTQHSLVRDYFLALDKNHDGHIQFAEIADAIEENKVNYGDKTKREVCEIFSRVPEGRKASINYSEFLAAMTYSHIALDEATLQSAFRKFDRDESGKMTTDSFKRVLGDSYEGEDLGALITKAGVLDADGKIGYFEFAKFFRKGSSKNYTPRKSEKVSPRKPDKAITPRTGELSGAPAITPRAGELSGAPTLLSRHSPRQSPRQSPRKELAMGMHKKQHLERPARNEGDTGIQSMNLPTVIEYQYGREGGAQPPPACCSIM